MDSTTQLLKVYTVNQIYTPPLMVLFYVTCYIQAFNSAFFEKYFLLFYWVVCATSNQTKAGIELSITK